MKCARCSALLQLTPYFFDVSVRVWGKKHTVCCKRMGGGRVHAGISAIANSQKLLCVCGAGISTSQEIPDFVTLYGRDPLLKRALSTSRHTKTDDERLARFLLEFYTTRPTPGPVHRWLAKLEEKGRLVRCYTMNIDGLEKKAGIRRLVEVHGTLAAGGRCGRRRLSETAMHNLAEDPIEWSRFQEVGACRVTPNIVMYGETARVPDLQWREDVRRADVIVCLGTTLSTNPIASMVAEAVKAGKYVLCVNKESVSGFPTVRMDLSKFVKRMTSM